MLKRAASSLWNKSRHRFHATAGRELVQTEAGDGGGGFTWLGCQGPVWLERGSPPAAPFSQQPRPLPPPLKPLSAQWQSPTTSTLSLGLAPALQSHPLTGTDCGKALGAGGLGVCIHSANMPGALFTPGSLLASWSLCPQLLLKNTLDPVDMPAVHPSPSFTQQSLLPHCSFCPCFPSEGFFFEGCSCILP